MRLGGFFFCGVLREWAGGGEGGGLLTQLFWSELRFNEGRVDVSLTVTHTGSFYIDVYA